MRSATIVTLLLAASPSLAAGVERIDLRGHVLVKAGKAKASAEGAIRDALGASAQDQSVTVVVCLGHPEAPRGKDIAGLGAAMTAVVQNIAKGSRGAWVARAESETTCPAGIRLERRRPPPSRKSARIAWIRGSVTIETNSGSAAAVEGQRVYAGDKLTAGEDSWCRLELPRGGAVLLKPRTELQYSGEKNRRTTLRLFAGRLWARVAKFTGRAVGLDIETDNAVAGIRGTEFRIVAEGDSRTRLETLESEVALTGGGSEVLVGEGFGARAHNADLHGPVALPKPPRGLSPRQGPVSAEATLSWRPADGATAYVVEIAQDVQFFVVVAETHSTSASTALPALEAGTYYWRVSSVDESGFVGLPSHLFRIKMEAP